ncbi:MAG: 23S rRNA (uracil(1939)-C(5))-methyltransferase RlmD [Anaerolineae bacterium]|nr:23S rRNA (uracil(1939)-C(5))-methyltransferase RlmD [Thermoflexales bacterium]HQW36447.1 23S rRNA (uracil(1939)-C(5))-methyltransferase RlmD [Thermoflexales bacterium]
MSKKKKQRGGDRLPLDPNTPDARTHLKLGDRVTLDLTAVTPHGDVIGRHEGIVVFVPYVLPGERVEVEISHVRRSFARGLPVQRLTDSPDRVTPPCPVFGVCGGCQWQHVRYEKQLEFKTDLVREQLTGIGKFENPNVLPCVPSPRPYEYRNRMQFSVSETGHPGFHRPGTREIHNVIEIDDCLISDPQIREKLQGWTPDVGMNGAGELVHQIDVRVTDREAEGGSILKVGQFEYFVSPQSFFQVNVGMAEWLAQHVVDALDLRGTETVLDLYCGVGLFTLPLAAKAARVFGVENNREAIEDAEKNKRQLPEDKQPVFIRADVMKAIKKEPMVSEHFDAIVVDPPRAGVFYDVLMKLIELRPQKLVYVSCDPATLARDLRILCDNGYALLSAQPFDMFPQTHHIETLASLALR